MSSAEKLQALEDVEAAADIVTGATSSTFRGHNDEAHRLQTRFANYVTSLLSVLRNKMQSFFCQEMVPILSRLTRDRLWMLTQPNYSAVPTERGILCMINVG